MPPTRAPTSDAALVIGRRAGATRLPIALAVPLPGRALVLATRDVWPVSKDLFCVELEAWPEDAEIVERVPVASCQRVGAAVHLVLDRAQRRRSLFVWTSKRGRSLIFWRSERSMKATRPGVRTPTARGLDGPLTVAIDERERYPWRFAGLPVDVERRRLPVGDYGVFEGERLVAVVERKRLGEFAGDAVQGRLQHRLAELATMPRAAVLIEGRLSQLLNGDLRTRPGWLLNLVAALQAAYPNVPLVFAESGPLAADLAYRWLSASLRLARAHLAGEAIDATLGEALGSRYAVQPAPAHAAVRDAPLFAPPDRVEVLRGSTRSDRAGRQEEALTRARAGETLTVREHAERHRVSAATASLDLHALRRRGVLVAHGRGPALHFTVPA
jgi:hypothetical protein